MMGTPGFAFGAGAATEIPDQAAAPREKSRITARPKRTTGLGPAAK